MMDLTPKEINRLQSQTKSYLQAAAVVFYDVMQHQKPLDRTLKQYFRSHPDCGSRDRGVITELCFSLYRWYGWLQKVMPKGCPENPSSSTRFCQACAAALWIDGHHHVIIFGMILKLAHIKDDFITDPPPDLEEKRKKLGHFFKIRKLSYQDLVPTWFVPTLEEHRESALYAHSMQTRASVWIRVKQDEVSVVKNQLKEQGIDFQGHEQCSCAIEVLTDDFNVQQLPGYHQGLIEVQDVASQCIGVACDASPEETWWDVCAGAGGKTLQLADMMHDEGTIVATDVRPEILNQLKKRAQRADVNSILVQDVTAVTSQQECFDGVLVDAPCSCTGVWRRNPELRWITSSEACHYYAEKQRDILAMVADHVKSGGVLVYATCSVMTIENEEVIHWFLEHHPEFSLEDFEHPFDEGPVSGMQRVDMTSGNHDAMFMSRLRKDR